MTGHEEEKGSTFIGSLFSRIRKPFVQNTRHFELSIQLDDPHRQYGPGDFITGDVVLRVSKAIDITHIVVCLHGFVQVYKTPNNPGAKYKEYNAALITGKTSKAGGYYGNGFASLFEDEVVLCGDGRIPEGQFRFGFELHFPKDQMPSSIDFERGTVSYMITSTLTRPSRASIINPITASETRVTFEDSIDIANIMKPKPRVVTLEPIIRRTRTRSRKPTMDSNNINGSPPNLQLNSTNNTSPTQPTNLSSAAGPSGTSGSSGPSTTGTVSNTASVNLNRPLPPPPDPSTPLQAEHEPPRSPGPSEDSFETGFSSGGTPSAAESRTQSHSIRITEGKIGKAPSRREGRSVVVSQVDLQESGYLRGDLIEIKIQISHYKQIKSLHGVIATLYRQARVDMHPALPIVTDIGDELFPRSRSGLGGLSLSSAGSSHQFRKDLDQNWAPIIINQDNLSADIKVSLCVPESAFPSISTAPGGMISFKYYVEVILDVNGKLAALDRYLPTPNINSLSSRNQGLGTPGAHANFHNGYPIDTEDIRREKSVVVTTFEVVVGTRDSRRTTKWQSQKLGQSSMADILGSQVPDIIEPSAISRAASSTGPMSSHSGRPEGSISGHSVFAMRPRSATQDDTNLNGIVHPRHLQVPGRSMTFPLLPHSHENIPAPDYSEMTVAPPPFPIPNIPDDSELDEKERIRRAEQRLLPSAPPVAQGEDSSAGASQSNAPSAPSLSDLGPFTAHMASAPPPSILQTPIIPSSSSVPQVFFPPLPDHPVPAYESHASSSAAADVHPTEDKQELERRRLEAARSAPDMTPQTPAEGSTVTPSAFPTVPSAPPSDAVTNPYAPTAPMLTDEDIYGFNAHPASGELPKYER